MKRKDLSNLKWFLGRVWQYAKKYRVSIIVMVLSMAIYALSSYGMLYFIMPFTDDYIIESTESEQAALQSSKTAKEEEPGLFGQVGLSFYRFFGGGGKLAGKEVVKTGDEQQQITARASIEDMKIGSLILICICILLLSIIAGGSHYLAIYLSRLNVTRIMVDIRSTLCRHMLSLSMKFFNERKMGDLLSRLTNDLMVSNRALNLLMEDFILQPFLIIVALAMAFAAHWKLAFILFVILPIAIVPMLKFGKKVLRSGKKSLDVLGDTTQAMTQMFSGIRTVKAFKMEDREIEEFDGLQATWLKKMMKMIRAKAGSLGVVSVFQGFGYSLMVAAAGICLILYPGFVTPGQLALLIMAMSAAYQPMKKLSKGYNHLNEALAGLQRVFEILELQPDIRDAKSSMDLSSIEKRIRLENVTFSYEEEEVLKNISFDVPVGKTVALVGPSGSGKSTLLDLIARFYDPTDGNIYIDDVNLKNIRLESLISHIAIVSQEPFLFHTTIGDNIRYGNREASTEEIIDAARAANIHEFIESLPEKYETVVGERGVRLSGGQLQRITIARAILKRASILLLDEATSSLDSEAEQAVQAALENLMKGKTSFVIAHRLSTIRNADLILVLDRGELVETGTHQDLIAQNGVYNRLHEMQFSIP